MGFNCRLDLPSKHVSAVRDPSWHEDLDHYETLAMYACSLLAQTDCRFRVSGFGDDEWPMDIGYDLSSVIEQLPDVLEFVGAREEGALDLYPQGIERTLRFLPQNDLVEITCHSRTSWVPNPSVELVPHHELESMLRELARDFAVSLGFVCDDVAGRMPFSVWRRW